MAARGRSVGHEPPEELAMTRHEPVDGIGNAPAGHSVPDQRPVASHEPPAREALVVGERGEERTGCRLVEREDR